MVKKAVRWGDWDSNFSKRSFVGILLIKEVSAAPFLRLLLTLFLYPCVLLEGVVLSLCQDPSDQ